MAEEYQSQDKTEEPTARKQEKAREQGQVARSRELSSMALLLCGSAGLLVFAGRLGERFAIVTRHVAELAAMRGDHMLEALGYATAQALSATLPLLVLVFFAAIASSIALGGFVFSAHALAFKGSRLSPLAGFKRMFSMRALVELAKGVAKIALVVIVTIAVLHATAGDLLRLGLQPIEGAMRNAFSLTGWSLLALSASLAVIAAIDVPFQLSEHNKQLRMTRQELRDEMKDAEGRPEVKGRIRRMQQELARRRMLADVPKADVVITNPEHYSVALRYQAESMSAPVVLAKGADLIALKIREIANASEVPIMPVPALTRAVYHSTAVGAEVPTALYVAIAQVLAYVYQLKQHRRGGGPAPRPLPELVIPDDYRKDD